MSVAPRESLGAGAVDTRHGDIRWTIDLGSKETQLQDPQVLVDMPVEFPR